MACRAITIQAVHPHSMIIIIESNTNLVYYLTDHINQTTNVN